jgi:hypothetical protein
MLTPCAIRERLPAAPADSMRAITVFAAEIRRRNA